MPYAGIELKLGLVNTELKGQLADNHIFVILSLYININPKTSSFINSEDSDEMPCNTAFHQGLHSLIVMIKKVFRQK